MSQALADGSFCIPSVTPTPCADEPVPVPPRPRVEAADIPALQLPGSLVRIGQALGGTAAFGFALRAAMDHPIPDLVAVAYTLTLPLATALAWLVCLPALYIFWAARQPAFGGKEYLRAALEGLRATGLLFAATSPILWFFAVTGDGSLITRPLGIGFTALAILAGSLVFGRSVRALGGELKTAPFIAFAVLIAVTFTQFASLAGIVWNS